MTCLMMTSLGVYVLGAADTDEEWQLEAHLPDCPECQAELRRLEPLPGLLAAIPESIREMPPSPGHQAQQPRRAQAHRGVRRRWAAAAAAAFVAGGVSGGLWLSSIGSGHQAVPLTLTGTDPATHVTATATLTATSWGSSIQLRVRGFPKDVQCHLVVRSLYGRTEVSGAWDAYAWQEGSLTIPASASWAPSDIASLQVTTPTKTLLTISAHSPTTKAKR
jgi:hypothetical protein